MDKQQVNMILDQLKNNEIQEYIVTKEVFYTFREVLVEREDFKHFRGNAQHGGKIIYTYMEMPRS
ncbi:abortive phage infection protein [Bacillus multifaciens]|uniref:abortive phage infection protein n=1 Tax=Bacillus multifaciens TaxID=3068506 RepID=UPI00274204CC|nr:abortive phage infection protein [Bacillus sp. WLY-B-L8]MDP7979365.1 abortive phage infection protein [Bacillus sp. WLY-B-L8]